ncbi:hypothetical protein WJX72_006739 [[Myrmecia] bisecta]|uniref:Uncharacterized protein n=1 Tax=[Myrmecia] bisecta TaxID=41462 RepID=A0AAW1Q5U8_9CHLO
MSQLQQQISCHKQVAASGSSSTRYRFQKAPWRLHTNTSRCQVRAAAASEPVQGQRSGATRLRVERQSHLPAFREEAWRALRSLVPEEDWREAAAVFAALENIYRVEYQVLGEELLQAFRAANSALIPLPDLVAEADNRRASRRSRKRARSETNSDQPAADAAGQSVSSSDEADIAGAPGTVTELQEGNVMTLDSGFSDEVETLPTSSMDVESVSRLEFDRASRLSTDGVSEEEAEAADQQFMQMLTTLLLKAHFIPFSARDVAMSRSLNSDYLDQLFIRADTKSMDEKLVGEHIKDRGLTEEAQSLLVYKRGYGQARKRGRMLLPKLDYLQLLIVKGVITTATTSLPLLWSRIRGLLGQPEEEAKATAKARKAKASVTAAAQGNDAPREQSVQGVVAADGSTGRSMQDTAEADKNWLQTVGSAVVRKLASAGVLSPRLMVVGGGLFITLSNWGLIPMVDVLPLEEFNEQWQPEEPERLQPMFVERVNIRDALKGRGGLLSGLPAIVDKVELVEPTYQELLVLYREDKGLSKVEKLQRRLAELRYRITGSPPAQGPRFQKRGAIVMRVYKDIPVPTWKIVFPNKLLQFRPLDGLRYDLLTLAGLGAVVAQAKYDSFILEVVTAVSAATFLFRVVLGYRRMSSRYEKMANDLLATSTMAGQDGVIDYLTGSAALQQFEQTALAYVLLQQSDAPLTATSLSAAAESMLEGKFQVRVRYAAEEALQELQRLGLLEAVPCESNNGAQRGALYKVVQPTDAFAELQKHWDRLLMEHVDYRELQ